MLAGCAGIDTLTGHDVYGGERELEPVVVTVGEEQGIVRQRYGLIPMPGGYGWGLLSADPSVVTVQYAEEGRSVLSSIVGRSPGTTYVFYVNRFVYSSSPELGPEYYGTSVAELMRDHRYFRVRVEPAADRQ